MKDIRFRTIRNALANIVRGGATAVVALALPRFLTRSLDQEHFAAWSLILQIAAYANYFDFGLQLAISRFMAQAIELDQRERQAKMIATSLFLLMLAGAIASIMIALVLWQLPHLFGGIGPQLLQEFRRACLILSLSTCLLLPLSTYTGVLIGMQRNEIPALAIGGSRVVGAVAVIFAAARHPQSLPVLALCVAVPNVVGGVAQMAAVRRLLEQSRLSIAHFSGSAARELVRFCAGLTVWSLGGLVINGLDLTIVGHFQFHAVGSYSLASMVIVFLVYSSASLLAALLAPLATLHARRDRAGMLRMLVLSTRLTLLLNLAFCALVFFAGDYLLRLWVGPVYATGALPILEVLAVAQTIRYVIGPLGTLVTATGEQHKALTPIIYEAVINLIASIAGAVWIGAIGVAWGTFLGAIFGLFWMLTRVMPGLITVGIGWRVFVMKAVAPACVPVLPLLLLWLMRHLLGTTAYGLSLGAGLITAGWLAFRLFRMEATTESAESKQTPQAAS